MTNRNEKMIRHGKTAYLLSKESIEYLNLGIVFSPNECQGGVIWIKDMLLRWYKCRGWWWMKNKIFC